MTATKDPAVIIGFSQAGWNGNFVAVAGQPLYYPLEFKLNSSGGAALSGVTWTAIDPMPASLSLTSTPPDQAVMFGASGAIFGTPSASGNFSFRIQATDGTHTETTMVNLAISADQNYQMSLPLANIGTPFSFALDRSWGDTLFAAFGKVPSGPYTFADPSHTLPAGLSISSAGPDLPEHPQPSGTVQPSLHVTGGAIMRKSMVPLWPSFRYCPPQVNRSAGPSSDSSAPATSEAEICNHGVLCQLRYSRPPF